MFKFFTLFRNKRKLRDFTKLLPEGYCRLCGEKETKNCNLCVSYTHSCELCSCERKKTCPCCIVGVCTCIKKG